MQECSKYLFSAHIQGMGAGAGVVSFYVIVVTMADIQQNRSILPFKLGSIMGPVVFMAPNGKNKYIMISEDQTSKHLDLQTSGI